MAVKFYKKRRQTDLFLSVTNWLQSDTVYIGRGFSDGRKDKYVLTATVVDKL